MGRTDEDGLDPSGEPLLQGPPSLFAADRPSRDKIWAFLWAISVALVVGGAVYAGVHRNPDFAKLIAPSYLSDAEHCPAVGPHGRRLLLKHGEDAQPTFFLQAAGLCTGVSILGGIGLALLSLQLFKRSAMAMVHAAVGIQIAIPAAIALAAFLSGAPAAGVPFALMSAALGLTMWLYRSQLALVARLLSISVHALVDQPSVIVAALLLQLLGLLVLVPMGGMMLLAFTNGTVVPNPGRAAVEDDGTCAGADGKAVACCSWQVDSWVPGYLAYAGMVATWTTLLVFTIKMFTIAGATAQWYFAPAGMGAPKGATLRSARQALGASFGSLCFASWLLTLIKMARATLDKIRQDNEGGVCALILTSCLDFLYAMFEAVTKFGVVRAAITGEAFMDACHGVVGLLSRNALDTVGVWFLPGFILQASAAMMAVAWGVLAYAGSTALWGGGHAASASGVVVGLLSGVFALITLAFLNGVLLNMVDATYVAWAMDRDAAAVTRSDVNDVFLAPGAPWHKAPGAIVEQPDAAYAYGAEAGLAGAGGPAAPQPYPSPAYRG
ncbi:MAG: plasma-membrane choline transporter-domain-containing protein [Monoraphidium minutum]|nr:MAG: plasma-membrane choline transporter-domain-containing protein [Monoraphidium minutum]